MRSPHDSPIREGLLDIWPLLIPVVPFGLVYGVLVAESSTSTFWGWLASPLIVAGASQLTLITLLDEGTAMASALASTFVINARHLMYSAAIAPRFSSQPLWFRVIGSFSVLDQTFAMLSLRSEEEDPAYVRRYWLTMGMMFTATWTLFTTVGILSGEAIPESWRVEFAVSVLFLSLVINGVKAPPSAVAASTGFAVAVVASPLPNRTGLLVGAVSGVIAGAITETNSR